MAEEDAAEEEAEEGVAAAEEEAEEGVAAAEEEAEEGVAAAEEDAAAAVIRTGIDIIQTMTTGRSGVPSAILRIFDRPA